MKVKMTRVKGGQALRTDAIEGEAPMAPAVGWSFMVVGEPLTEGALERVVTTSAVAVVAEYDVGEKRRWEIETKTGSQYLVVEL